MDEVVAMRALPIFAALFLGVIGCASPNSRPAITPSARGPTAIDFHQAMEDSLPHGRDVLIGHCGRVTQLKCSPVAGGQRYQCGYRYGSTHRGIAVIERREGRFWRWVSGPKKCSIVTAN